jgi:ketosteroid isomerase-like protein
MTTQPSTTADSIALVPSAFDAINEGDIDTCLAHLSPDFVINLAGVPPMQSREVWRQGVDVIKRGFPDLHAHEFYRIVDGVFAEEWICSDMAGLHGQLTAIAGT